MCLAVGVLANSAVAQQTQPPSYSTHDWTVTGPSDALREGWVDVKAPWGPVGSRPSYVVGTIEIRQSGNATNVAQFSGSDILATQGMPEVVIPGTTLRKQVVILQCLNEDQTIRWQRFFYGGPGSAGQASLESANARGISVWASDDPADTRIAICGEVYDPEILFQNYGNPPVTPNTGSGSGFIAVYDGNGGLLWTDHLFANPVVAGQSAVTDLSIRLESNGVGGLVEVVTYCGITTHGTPAAGFTQSPLQPFAMLAAGESDGATNQGNGQWDGFVGRVRFVQGVVGRDFQSTVGGPGQDGLFGIAELSRDRFVVVGSCQTGGVNAFPGSSNALVAGANSGVVAVFDAGPTRTGGALILEGVNLLGDNAPGSASTHLRDVAVGFNANAPSDPVPAPAVEPGHMIYVVGSTDDVTFVNEFTEDPLDPVTVDPSMIAPGILFGNTDGVVLSLRDVPGSRPLLRSAGFVGGPDEDGLTGVGGWSEFGEHFTVCGWTDVVNIIPAPDLEDGDILVRSFINDTAAEVWPTPVQQDPATVRPLREAVVGGTTGGSTGFAGHDRPAAGGAIRITNTWNEFGLGRPGGGGIAVDARARVTVVGQTYCDNYPVVGGRPTDNSDPDAVRTTIDLLPVGVGRTDGTGDALPSGMLPAGFTGGTSPVCALAPYGIRITDQGPGIVLNGLNYPLLQRMLIDYEGPGPNSASPGPLAGVGILFVRPPSTPADPQQTPPPSLLWKPVVVGAALNFGFPQPAMLPTGLELFVPSNSVVLVGAHQPNRPLRQRMFPAVDSAGNGIFINIPPGIDFMVQLVCLVSDGVPDGFAGNCAQGGLSTIVAGPGLWVDN